MSELNLERVEQDIYDFYQFFAITAPGVTPRLEGRLGQLWAHFDYLAGDSVLD